MDLQHAAEFRRCLVQLDVAGIRKLWAHVSPQLPQPKDDDEALHTLHLARTKCENLPEKLKAYSRAWLDELAGRPRIVNAVGVAIMAPPHRMRRALDIRTDMLNAVSVAHREGVDLAKDAAEVTRRMNIARDRHYVAR